MYDIRQLAYTIFAICISLKLITPEASVNCLDLNIFFRNKYFCTIQSKKITYDVLFASSTQLIIPFTSRTFSM